jgi:hypothetical protein
MTILPGNSSLEGAAKPIVCQLPLGAKNARSGSDAIGFVRKHQQRTSALM